MLRFRKSDKHISDDISSERRTGVSTLPESGAGCCAALHQWWGVLWILPFHLSLQQASEMYSHLAGENLRV